MTAPHGKLALLRSLLLALALLGLGPPARGSTDAACIAPPLVAPTREPPRADAIAPVPTKPVAAVEPVDPPAPLIVLRVRVPARVAASQELDYRICVENCSPAA